MTTDSRKIQLETAVDATGAKAGFQQVKDAAKDMASSVAQAGQEAAKGVSGIGNGADAAAAKADRATSNLIGSIQRATAAAEAGKKSGSAFYESLATQRGVSVDALKPYLSQLDAVIAKQRAAQDSQQQPAGNPQGEALLANLREQVRLYGKTSDEVLKYRAAQAGVGAEASNLILQLQNIKAATQAKAAADDAAAAAAQRQAAALRQTASAQQAFLSSLREQVATKGLDPAGLLAYRAAQLGVSKEAEQLIAQLGKSKDGLGKVGVSAAQTAAALRGVPAQFTDIVTSLQGGQAPLTVFLQQGGQLKDMFGGVGQAAKALGGYVLGLINPFTVAGAAVATLGIAYYQGAKESENYNKSLILTGNYLGLTVSGMQAYAKTISATVGTQGAAADALTALANSGKVARESLTSVGTAVVYMNRVLGESVDKATETFTKLADEPTKASQKLNESMHYLNLATYERIRALEEQGDKEAAAALAQKTLADATTTRLKAVEAGTGSLERGWRALADGAKAAWDAMLGIGRSKSIGDALGEAQTKLNEARAQAAKGGAYASLYGPSVKKGEADVAALSRSALNAQEKAIAEGEKARNDAAQIASSDRLKKLTDEVMSNADKRKKAIKDLDNDFKTLGKATSGAEYDKLVANINDKFKDPKTPKVKAFQDDQGTKTLETLRQQEAALKAQLAIDDKLTAADQERAKYLQLFADLKIKGVLTADQKSLLANEQAIRTQLDQNVAVEALLEKKKEAARLDKKANDDAKEFARQIEGINISIASAQESRRDQQERSLEAFGLGDRARQEVEAQRTIRKEYEAYKRQLTKDAAEKNQLGSDAYKSEVAKIQTALDEALASQQKYFDELKAKREDWVNGATTALANYIDEINDASKRAQDLVTGTLGGITDGITGLLMGDKSSSFKDVGKKIAEQITRGIVEQQITKPIAEWLQGSLKDGDSMIGKLIGGLTSNKSSGENWLSVLGLGGSKSKGGGTDALGDFLKGKGLLGDASGSAANTALAASASAATSAIAALASAAAAAAASLGGSSVSGLGSSLGGLFSSGGGFGTGNAFGNLDLGGFFANGGDPPVGKVSIVGERGPELFVPKQSGTIIPNEALGGGKSNVININYHAQPGETRKTASQNGRAFADQAQKFQRRDS